jgi:hypothetical protein
MAKMKSLLDKKQQETNEAIDNSYQEHYEALFETFKNDHCIEDILGFDAIIPYTT